jgi:hypothetical protein
MSSKLREVLVEVESILSTWIDHLPPVVQEEAQEALNKAEAVINEPLRNCDIGTADEQTKRFREFCSAHKYLSSDFSYICKGFGKGRCPFSNSHTKSSCELAWSQMPYEGKMKE